MPCDNQVSRTICLWSDVCSQGQLLLVSLGGLLSSSQCLSVYLVTTCETRIMVGSRHQGHVSRIKIRKHDRLTSVFHVGFFFRLLYSSYLTYDRPRLRPRHFLGPLSVLSRRCCSFNPARHQALDKAPRLWAQCLPTALSW
jgi:hypothetical protein